nr:reverse transcriptase domain-containing protein [Tanacetum cinerariifolium]
MIQQVQNSCQFHALSGDNANKRLDKFLHVTQSIKVNGVTNDALRLYLFPHSLTHHATAWFDHLPRNSINTFEQMEKMFLGKYFPPSMVTKLRNEITNFRQRPDESLFEAWEGGTFMKRRPEECYDLIENMTAHHNDWDTFINQQVKAVAHNCETCGGPHSYNDCPATVGQTQNVYAAGAYNQDGNSYQPQVVPTTEFINYMKANDAILKNMQTNMTSLTNSNLDLKNMFGQFMKMNNASSSGSRTLPSNTITNPKDDLKGITTRSRNAYQGPRIPTTSSPPKVVERETKVTKDTVPPTNKGSTKDVQPPVVQVEIQVPILSSLLLPLLSPLKLLLSINLMPLSVWYKLSLAKLTPTLMTLKLAYQSISQPIDVAEDVFVKVGKFHFPADFVVVDFDADPRVPLILRRSFSKTGRALIDVYARELTLRVNNEAVTFNLDQTSRYSANYNDMTANRIGIIDMAYEEYS